MSAIVFFELKTFVYLRTMVVQARMLLMVLFAIGGLINPAVMTRNSCDALCSSKWKTLISPHIPFIVLYSLHDGNNLSFNNFYFPTTEPTFYGDTSQQYATTDVDYHSYPSSPDVTVQDEGAYFSKSSEVFVRTDVRKKRLLIQSFMFFFI